MNPFQWLSDFVAWFWEILQSLLASGLAALASILPTQFSFTATLVALLDLSPYYSYLVVIAHWFPLWALAFAFQIWLAVEAVLIAWYLYRVVRLATI